MEKKSVGFIYPNFTTDQLKSFQEVDKMNMSNMIRKLSQGIPREYLICMPKYDCYLQHIVLKSAIMEEFINQLSLMKPEDVPILIYRHMETNLTPLDVAIKENNINSVNMLIGLLLKYQNNACFNYLIDP